MSDFVTVWRKRDGRPQTIPRDWLDHPTLAEPFTTTQPEQVDDACYDCPDTTPTDTTTKSGPKSPRKRG